MIKMDQNFAADLEVEQNQEVQADVAAAEAKLPEDLHAALPNLHQEEEEEGALQEDRHDVPGQGEQLPVEPITEGDGHAHPVGDDEAPGQGEQQPAKGLGDQPH